jgi:protein phosphatase
MRRTTNQDAHALLVADNPERLRERGHLLMVADGMGAHAAGELASKLAADGVPHLYFKYRELAPAEALRRAIVETNTEIHRRGMANADFHNMGTTCSVLVLAPLGALVAHVGDSRVYRLRGNTISQLTFDHSLQWELKASGQLPEGSDLSAVVPKNVITRSLGPNPQVQIDMEGPFPIAEGDVFLLCSDGLTGRVEDAELGAILASVPPQEAAQALVDLANLRGGPDNITVLVAKVTGGELVSAGAGAALPAETARGGDRRGGLVGLALLLAGGAAAGALLAVGQPALAGISLVAGAALAAVAWVLVPGRVRGTPGGDRLLGRGPYTSVVCTPSSELVSKLAGTLDELREATNEGEWEINWQPLEACCQQALAASRAGNFAEATRAYCRGISFVMNELRTQNAKKAGDSAVPL